jgi:hypothetical protein
VKDLFGPSSVVVIGVSTRAQNLGKEIARNLFEFRYSGVIHLVSLHGGILLENYCPSMKYQSPRSVDSRSCQQCPGHSGRCGPRAHAASSSKAAALVS